VVHLVRNSLRYSNRKDWQHITPGLRAIYTAPTIEAAQLRFDEFTDRWQPKYPAMMRLWQSAREKFTPFLAFDIEIRKLINTTNMIESLNSRFRQATCRRGHFTTEQAAMKVLYLAMVEKQRAGNNITARIPAWGQVPTPSPISTATGSTTTKLIDHTGDPPTKFRTGPKPRVIESNSA
jgi:transposase-like protein